MRILRERGDPDGQGFLDKNPQATAKEIQEVLSNVLCRCFTHVRMHKAIETYAGLAKRAANGSAKGPANGAMTRDRSMRKDILASLTPGAREALITNGFAGTATGLGARKSRRDFLKASGALDRRILAGGEPTR